MKKAIRVITAVILAMIIATGSVSAFASSETVVLDFAGEKFEYFYGGKLTEGENNLDFSGDELYLYYEFEAEKDGYYVIETDPWHILWFACAKKTASGRYDDDNLADYSNLVYSETEENLFYFEKGTYTVFADKNEEINEKTTVGIEYAGAELTAVDFDGGVKYGLIYDLDIYCEYDEDIGKYLGIFNSGNATLSFDSGKTYGLELGYLWFESESGITEGENTITFDFVGKPFEKTILVENIDKHIKSVEVTNFDEFDTVEVYYDGCLNDYDVDFTGLEMVVEFINGEKETVVVDSYYTMVKLPNGNPMPIELYCSYDTDDNGNVVFSVWIADTYFTDLVVLPVEAVETSTFENMEHLSEENTNVIIGKTDEIFLNYINILLGESTDEIFSELKVLFENYLTFIPDIVKGIFGNISLFLGF